MYMYASTTPLNSPRSPRTLTQLLPDLTRANSDPLLHTLHAVQCRPDIQCKDRVPVWCRWSRVVVDHVPYFFPCSWSPNDPVMAIKGRLGAITNPRQSALTRDAGETYLNREGSNHPANIQTRAFGDISPGRPLNFARYGSSSPGLRVVLSVALPEEPRNISYRATRFSHFSTSPQARSFRKL